MALLHELDTCWSWLLRSLHMSVSELWLQLGGSNWCCSVCTLLGCFSCCSFHLLLYVQSVSSHGSSRWLHLRDSSYQQTTCTCSHISSRAALKCCAQCACQWQLQSAELWSEIKNTTTHIIIDMCNYNLHHYDNNDFINKGLTGSPVGCAVSSTQHTVVTWHLITQLIINK